MSRHRIVHTFDANEIVSEYDGDYEEEEEDELSPEDRQAMEQGTAQIQQALGTEASKVTKDQIQEALWHYYYDIDKSVTYLMKTFIAPAPKAVPAPAPAPTPTTVKKAPEGMFKSVFLSSRIVMEGTGALDEYGLSPPSVPPRWQFDDMPWMKTRQDGQAIFIEPDHPRGLRGGGDGAPKMSKLQALAAARKKKNEKKETASEVDTPQVVEATVSQGLQSHAPQPVLAPEGDMQKLSITQTKNRPPESRPTLSDLSIEPVKAAPSAFAQTLFGPTIKDQRPEVFAMPYASSSSFLAQAFAEPSPDDIVLAAQAKAGKKPVAKPKKSQKDGDVEKDLASLRVDSPPPKSKGLDVVKEFENSKNKRNISFVVVGHVDAGKSTLMGRLLLELKLVEKHIIDRYRRLAEKSGKQSFALAWVMDQRSEERERGVTIDIATNYFETDKTSFTILDAPGHRDFVPNMIAGASQADFAILVIDANTGAYEKGLKGQTREHVLLLRSLGVQRLIVAVNKLDMVDWSQDRFEEIDQQVSGFLTGLGFQTKNVSFIPISGLNGDNIITKTEAPAASWYTGPTLIEALEDSEPSTARALKKPFRMAISEIFRSPLGTTTVAGRIDSGSVQVGDVILVQPSGEEANIKSIMVDSDVRDWSVAGQSVSIALTNIDPIHIRVGDMVCHTTQPITCGDTFTIKAMAFEHLMPMPIDLHRGRLHSAGQIVSFTATLDKATGAVLKKKPRVVQPGGVARAVIKLASKIPLESGQRIVIRSGGETVAAGLVE